MSARRVLILALAAGLSAGAPVSVLTPSAVLAQALPVDRAACLAAPSPACLAELALEAARAEPEGWAITAAFEAFLSGDPSPEGRDTWMARYEAHAASSTADGVRERIVPVRAEHLARKGDFAGAYRELGLDRAQPDGLSDPTVLILDEARAGRVADALARVDRLVESDARDDIRIELLEIALAKAPDAVEATAAAIRGRFTRRLAQALQAGARGDAAIGRSIEEWARGARSTQTYPFDDPETSRRESWDAVMRGAVAANNLASFRAALAARPPFESAADAESVSRLMRPLLREARADWIRVLGPAIRLPADEALAVDEEVGPLRNLPTERLLAVAAAAETTGVAKAPIVDLVVEMLASRGDVAPARDLFLSAGRVEELNRVAYDQARVGVIFETLWRAVAGRLPKAEVDAFAARLTSDGAKAYVARVARMAERKAAILAGNKGEEPADDEWSIMLDLALASGDLSAMARLAAEMRDPGLRATAYVQILRLIWERSAR